MKRRLLNGLLPVLTAALLTSCTSTDGTGPSAMSSVASSKGSTAIPTTLNLVPRLAVCSVQPYGKVTQVIGASGGSLKIGKNKFEIPSHALLFPVRITMEVFADSTRSVQFSPEGLVFNPTRLPKLELDTKGCNLPKGFKNKVAYTTNLLRILNILPSVVDSLNGTVGANLSHFSRYAVAW